jgi:hypothetical protein
MVELSRKGGTNIASLIFRGSHYDHRISVHFVSEIRVSLKLRWFDMHCKHCGGNVIGGSCLQCSRPAITIVPYKIRSFDEYEEEERRKRKKAGRQGVCRCCGRTDRLWTDNLCSSCADFVNGRRGKYYPVKSPEREAALARVRARMTEKEKRAGLLKNHISRDCSNG